jgi:predicted heme/steroid binding protein
LAPSALRIVEAENTSTDLSNVQEFEGSNVQKFVENGKLYILREGVVYDVTGKVVR